MLDCHVAKCVALALIHARRRREAVIESRRRHLFLARQMALIALHQARYARLMKRRRCAKRRREMLYLLLALLTKYMSVVTTNVVKNPRRIIQRGTEGWRGSAIEDYVAHGDKHTYALKFRVTRACFLDLCELLSTSGYLRANECRNPERRQTAQFKLGVCLYFMAGNAKGDVSAVGDAGHIGRSTVLSYLDEFVVGTLKVLKPLFMSNKPPAREYVRAVRAEFASRRGIANVGMAVDGSHVPYVPQEENTKNDYKNYKGWMSILVVAFVNSFHLFVDVEAGWAGKSGDNTVLSNSWLLDQCALHRAAWLGENGLIAADGGASDGGQLLLNPIPNATDVADQWYNFCHASTRFYVEETFGRWKNRFRFLLYACDMDHKRVTNIIYCSCIWHNICTLRKDRDLDIDCSDGADDEWKKHLRKKA